MPNKKFMLKFSDKPFYVGSWNFSGKNTCYIVPSDRGNAHIFYDEIEIPSEFEMYITNGYLIKEYFDDFIKFTK